MAQADDVPTLCSAEDTPKFSFALICLDCNTRTNTLYDMRIHIPHHCPAGKSVYVFCGRCKLKSSKWPNLVHHLSSLDARTARPCRAKFAFSELPPPAFPSSQNSPSKTMENAPFYGHTLLAKCQFSVKKSASSTVTTADIHDSPLPHSSAEEPAFKVPEPPRHTLLWLGSPIYFQIPPFLF